MGNHDAPTPVRGSTAVSIRQSGDQIWAFLGKHFFSMLLTAFVALAWGVVDSKHAEAITKIEEQKVEDAKQFEALRADIRELQKDKIILADRFARIETTMGQLLNEVKELRADLRRRDRADLSTSPGIKWSEAATP